jgi:uncharacterized oligopeptide transporter (OPT) family protein
MRVADYIQRHGFRRWYERQLIESHAYLALAFVALILLLSGVEVLGDAKGGPYLAMLAAAALGGVLMIVAWRRFTVLLTRAEPFAEGATCPACKAWGRFRVTGQESATEDDPPEAGRPHWLRVRCTQCSHEWRIG